MKQKKYTKRALCMSVLSMLLCCSMLVGTTFAWFTDSVTSGKNKIVAGNLDVELEYQNAKATSFSKVTEDTKDLFVSADGGNILWEPGVAAVTYLKLENVGTLALKYVLSVLADDVETGSDGAALSDVLKSAVVEIEESEVGTYDRAKAIEAAKAADAESLLNYKKVGTMEPGEGSTLYFAAIVYFPEEIGNTVGDKLYNRGDVTLETDLSISLFATQAVSESDSFDNTYDKDAPDKDGGSLSVGSVTEKVTDTFGSVTLDVNGLTPAGEGKTEVVFEDGALPFESSAAEHTVTLTVFTENIVEANPDFTVDESGMGAVASIDLTLTVDGSAVHTFAGGKGATVTTYIEKNLRDVTVKYGDEEISGVSYVPATGELTFQASHFSKYTVYALTEATSTVHPDTEDDVPGANEIWIYNEVALRDFANKVSGGDNFRGKTVKLMADIDLGGREWVPIGAGESGNKPFGGTFDGNGKTISNMHITKAYNNYVGLFAQIGVTGGQGGTIQNLTIDGAVLESFDVGISNGRVGVVVGSGFTGNITNVHVTNAKIIDVTTKYLGGISGHGYATIDKCMFEGEIITKNAAQVGGIVGMQAGKIMNCYVDAQIRGQYTIAGGITGFSNGAEGVKSIENCYVTGSIERTGTYYGGENGSNVAGISGFGYGSTSTKYLIKNCYCDAEVGGGQMIVANCAGDYGTNEMFEVINCSWSGETDSYTYYGSQNKENGYVYDTITRSAGCTFTEGMTSEAFFAWVNAQ